MPDRKEPLGQFLKSSEEIPQGPAQLESERRTTAQLYGNITKTWTNNDI